MRKKYFFLTPLLAALLCLGGLYAWAGQAAPLGWPVGNYTLQGTNLKGGLYDGQVSIRQAGQAYIVEWRLGSGEFYKGVGVASTHSLAVAFNGGVALYERDKDGRRLGGVWAMRGNTRVGLENLIRH